MYVPNNTPIFLAAFAGCLAGLGATGRYLNDPNPADYNLQASSAFAFAQEFDTQWGTAPFTNLELVEIEEAVEGVWETRSPLPTASATIPGAYTGLVKGVIALVREGNLTIVGAGIDPNDIGGVGATGATGATGASGTGFKQSATTTLAGALVEGNPAASLTPASGLNFVCESGDKLIITASGTAVDQTGEGHSSFSVFIYVDGVQQEAQGPLQVPPQTDGTGLPFSFTFETDVLAAGTHNVDVLALCLATNTTVTSGRLVVMRVNV